MVAETYSPRRSPKPPWLRVTLPHGETYALLKNILKERKLHTVCEEARCPNLGECWESGTATFMILGDVCTRGCRFCAVKTKKTGITLDPKEPENLADAVKKMNLDYVVITSVDRDDLPDQGASHFADVIRTLKTTTQALVEVLIPDFRGEKSLIRLILASKPDVFAHNLETVRRLTPYVRDRRADYYQSLQVLQFAKACDSRILTKSSLMVGLGETREEIQETFLALRESGVDFLTIGQYLQPTAAYLPVSRYIPPEEFEDLQTTAESFGFRYVAAGPLVRSSYRAGEFFAKSLAGSV